MPDWITVGEKVLVRPYSLPGIVAFIGETQFAPGSWVGVALQSATGTIVFPSNLANLYNLIILVTHF